MFCRLSHQREPNEQSRNQASSHSSHACIQKYRRLWLTLTQTRSGWTSGWAIFTHSSNSSPQHDRHKFKRSIQSSSLSWWSHNIKNSVDPPSYWCVLGDHHELPGIERSWPYVHPVVAMGWWVVVKSNAQPAGGATSMVWAGSSSPGLQREDFMKCTQSRDAMVSLGLLWLLRALGSPFSVC